MSKRGGSCSNHGSLGLVSFKGMAQAGISNPMSGAVGSLKVQNSGVTGSVFNLRFSWNSIWNEVSDMVYLLCLK